MGNSCRVRGFGTGSRGQNKQEFPRQSSPCSWLLPPALTCVQARRTHGCQEPLPLVLPAEGNSCQPICATAGARGHSPRASTRVVPMGSAPRGAVTPGHSPAALPAGNEQREDVEGEEDAEAEEHTAHVGLGCAEPGQALSRGGTSGDLPRVPAEPSTPSPSQTHRLWRVTPSPPVSSAGCADPRVHLKKAGTGLSSLPCPQLVPTHSPWWQPHCKPGEASLERG